MKRKKVLYSVLAVVVINLFSVFYICKVAFSSEKEIKEAEITAQDGTCKAMESGAKSWQNAEVGDKYDEGSRLRTGNESYMEVSFDENNQFRLKSNTQILVEKIAEAAKDLTGKVVKLIRLNLIEGDVGIRLNMLPKDHILKVASPTAVAGASGTGFSVFYDKLKKLTEVKVVENEVVVEALDRANKFVQVKQFQQVTATPWKGTGITAVGVGVLSERILGKDFIDKFREKPEEVKIIAEGEGKPPKDEPDKDKRQEAAYKKALDDALSSMAGIIIPMPVDEFTNIADLLRDNPEVSKKVYDIISKSKVIDKQFAPDDSCKVTVQIDLDALSEAIGRDLNKILGTVREIKRREYLQKFGINAYRTTKRAAEVDGQRRLAEKIYGSVIDAKSTLRDEAAINENVRVTVRGVVENAKIVGERYFADGSIQLTLAAAGNEIQRKHGDIVGETFLSSPEVMLVTDFEEFVRLSQ